MHVLLLVSMDVKKQHRHGMACQPYTGRTKGRKLPDSTTSLCTMAHVDAGITFIARMQAAGITILAVLSTPNVATSAQTKTRLCA